VPGEDGVCESALAAADFSASVASESDNVSPAAEAAFSVVWPVLSGACESALPAADFSASLASEPDNVSPAAEAASLPV
jgi:hypothetical protein